MKRIITLSLSATVVLLFGFYKGAALKNKTGDHYVGEKYGGGIVFYVTADKKHGLISSSEDQAKVPWYNGVYKLTGTSDENLKDGKANTDSIISKLSADNAGGTYAAKVCADYSIKVDGQVYDDWYLPSRKE